MLPRPGGEPRLRQAHPVAAVSAPPATPSSTHGPARSSAPTTASLASSGTSGDEQPARPGAEREEGHSQVRAGRDPVESRNQRVTSGAS